MIFSKTLSPLFLFSLPLLLFFFFFTCSQGCTETAQNLIFETCKTSSQRDPTFNLGFCTSSLQAAPASRCATLVGLGRMTIRLVHDNVTDIRCQVKQLLRKKLDQYVKVRLEDCLELYTDAIYAAEKAMQQYKAKSYGEANRRITYVMDAASTCEDGFMEKEDGVSPLTKENSDAFKLSAMALSIMALIQSGSHDF